MSIRYDTEARQRAARRRQERLEAARAKGTHSKAEWQVLHDLFGRCVSCGIDYSELHGGSATKDHIEMVALGGCDCIGNLQPVCRNCNSAGIGGDMRNSAVPGWCQEFIERMTSGAHS